MSAVPSKSSSISSSSSNSNNSNGNASGSEKEQLDDPAGMGTSPTPPPIPAISVVAPPVPLPSPAVPALTTPMPTAPVAVGSKRSASAAFEDLSFEELQQNMSKRKHSLLTLMTSKDPEVVAFRAAAGARLLEMKNNEPQPEAAELPPYFRLTIRPLMGQPFTVHLPEDACVFELKDAICSRTQIPPEMQLLGIEKTSSNNDGINVTSRDFEDEDLYLVDELKLPPQCTLHLSVKAMAGLPMMAEMVEPFGLAMDEEGCGGEDLQLELEREKEENIEAFRRFASIYCDQQEQQQLQRGEQQENDHRRRKGKEAADTTTEGGKRLTIAEALAECLTPHPDFDFMLEQADEDDDVSDVINEQGNINTVSTEGKVTLSLTDGETLLNLSIVNEDGTAVDRSTIHTAAAAIKSALLHRSSPAEPTAVATASASTTTTKAVEQSKGPQAVLQRMGTNLFSFDVEGLDSLRISVEELPGRPVTATPVTSTSTSITKDDLTSLTQPSTPPPLPSGSSESTIVRCHHCGKKCRLAGQFTCRCGFIFCPDHRYHDKHQCTFDHRKNDRDRLAAANPRLYRSQL